MSARQIIAAPKPAEKRKKGEFVAIINEVAALWQVNCVKAPFFPMAIPDAQPRVWQNSRPSAIPCSLPPPLVAIQSPAQPDAELIALCDRIITNRAEQDACVASDPWAPDDGPLSAQYNDLQNEWIALVNRLKAAEAPTTLEGIRAAARMAWNSSGRDSRGRVFSCSPCDWIRLTALAWAAGEGDAPLLPSSWPGARPLAGELVA